MIEVKDLVKRYGDHVAVDHLTFTVEEGQIYGFLGPNGAGKSTTMNILTGYIASTEGTVSVDGHDILEEPKLAKQCIGYLPEQPPLYQDMIVKEYLRFVMELKGVKKEDRAPMLTKILVMTGIEDVQDRLIKNLSKGYKQRVGLAQALVGFPKVLILDEPTVGLDPKQMIEMRDLIRELGNEHTVILSSHILSEVSAVCDQILIISKGKLVACDTPENLSRQMAGAQKLEMLVKGTSEQIQAELDQIENVAAYTGKKSDEPGVLRVEIEAAADADIREVVFARFTAAKLPILEMHTTNVSLEDVFLELTQSDTPIPAEEDDGGDYADNEAIEEELVAEIDAALEDVYEEELTEASLEEEEKDS